MSDNGARLLVTLEARVNKFEKDLARANGSARREFGAIEKRSQQMTQRLDTHMSTASARITKGVSAATASFRAGVAGFIGGIVSQLSVDGITQALGKLAELQDTADRTGMSATSVQEFAYAVEMTGGAATDAAGGLEKFAVNSSKAAAGSGDLAELFKANGVAIRDASGAIRPMNELVGEVANLVKGATSEQDRLNIAAMAFGKAAGPAVVGALKEGASGLDAFRGQAHAAGVVLEDSLIKKAADLDDQLLVLGKQISGIGSSLAAEFGGPMVVAALTSLRDMLREISFTIDSIRKGNWQDALPFFKDTPEGRRQSGARSLKAGIGTSGLTADDIAKFYDRTGAASQGPSVTITKPGRVTRVPQAGGGGSSGYKRTADDRINDDIQALKDRTAALISEAAAVGLGYQEQQRRKMALDLEQNALAELRAEAQRKGQTDLDSIKLSDEQRAKIDAASDAYARQAAMLRQVEDAQDRAESAADEFYSTFKNGMTGAITGANSFRDALTQVLQKLSDMLLNSAFDSLFKPASDGSGGGALGGVFSGIGKLLGFDKGGWTGSGGVDEPAGVVHGQEIVWSKRDIARAGGPSVVEAMRLGKQGYAGGGAVGMTVPRAPAIPAVIGKDRPLVEGSRSYDNRVSVSHAPVFNMQGGDAELRGFVEAKLRQSNAELPSRVIAAVRDARKHNVKLL